jgi:NAD(P)-dependent dehydrogenase (short-subunit alcohol dehydrogenase family)
MANVLITGANKGIGLELTRIYAAAGDTVYACCRNPGAAAELAELADTADVRVVEVAVSNAESVAGLAAGLEGVTIDVLINNAGMSGPAYDQQNAQAMDFDGWAETFAVNTMAPVRVMQALLANLRRSDNAKVVNITSQMGALSLDMAVAYAYCSSKAALNKFMKLAAIELGREGISICLVHPGWVKTDMGGPGAEITAQASAAGIVDVIAGLSAETNGSFWTWNGETHAW